MKPADMPAMTLYTVVFVRKGCGTEAAQSVLASSVKSAVKLFYSTHSDTLITRVAVGDRTIMYEEANEITEEIMK